MVDPKYSHLPGIVSDQPDVYETDDLPEDDQAQLPTNDSENVESIEVKPNEAFKIFKNSTIDSSNADFSDEINRDKKSGFLVKKTEYEIVGSEHGVETVQQKYHRILAEIKTLEEDVNKIKEQAKIDDSTEKLSAVDLSRQVEYLQKQVHTIELDKVCESTSAPDIVNQQSSLQRRLLSELENNSSVGEKAKLESKHSGSKDLKENVTYKLFCKPEQTKFSNSARSADIDQRLDQLEATIGANSPKMSMLSDLSGSKSLLNSIASLESKVKLLTPQHLEQIEGRFSALAGRLNQINESKETIEKTDQQKKVQELFEVVSKWEKLFDTIPHVVDRLVSVSNLHEQALEFSQTLQHLNSTQEQINERIITQEGMVKNIAQTFQDNIQTIESNIKGVNTRIEKLSKT